jgi:ABC-type thiamin/hydroxymethylpyrimidine transport system permease subunit
LHLKVVFPGLWLLSELLYGWGVFIPKVGGTIVFEVFSICPQSILKTNVDHSAFPFAAIVTSILLSFILLVFRYGFDLRIADLNTRAAFITPRASNTLASSEYRAMT